MHDICEEGGNQGTIEIVCDLYQPLFDALLDQVVTLQQQGNVLNETEYPSRIP